ncbi:MAG: multicopper oxidase domain-containing protein [Propionicimonas sp.]
MFKNRTLLTVGTGFVLLVAMSGCATNNPSSSPPTAPTTSASTPAVVCANPSIPTELPPAVADLTASTTTPAGGAVVETSFPTVQGLPFVDVPSIASKGGVVSASFNASDASYTVAGRKISGLTYQGQFMGPTLLVDPGDTIQITLKNSLKDATNFHTHGVHTSPITTSDNVLRVMPGAGTDNPVLIQIPKKIAPGTYWYHAHLHGLTEEQVMGGLSGAIVISGLNDRLPKELQAIPDHLLGLKDVQLKGNTIVNTNIDSNAATTRLVNAQVNPVLAAQPGCTQLLRLGNFSADIWYHLKLDGAKFFVIAEDANVVTKVQAMDELLLPPAKRFDVLVRWDDPGDYKLRTLAYSTGTTGDNYPERVLATFTVAGEKATPIEMPTSMGDLPSDQAPVMNDDTIAAHRTMVFSENTTAGTFFINGKQFSNGAPLVTAKLGTTEEWTLKNVTQEEHPFHIHVNDFQIMSINGKPYDAVSLQDTVPLPAGGEVVIRMRFLDYVGKYVFHCHILAHEDGGMMAAIAITEDGKTPSVDQQDAWGQPLLDHSTMPGMP